MLIMKVSAYPSITYKGNSSGVVNKTKDTVAELAKKELENIEAQGKVAGTDSAWWRYGWGEAKTALEKLAKSGSEDTSSSAYSSGLMSFHDADDDGFI